jgi:hypothetical protein
LLVACLGCVGHIYIIHTPVALLERTLQAILENIQNKLRAGVAMTAILPSRGVSKRFVSK